MTTIQTIILTAILATWLCFSVVFLVYDCKREKREREQAKRDEERSARDLEYHQKRMESLK